MMMTMPFPKEKTLLLVSYLVIILLCIPVIVLSEGSASFMIGNSGMLRAYEFPPSDYTYRIFQNATFAYRINSLGYVDDHNTDPAVVINKAMSNCSTAGGGSVYVFKNTYTTPTVLGGTLNPGQLSNVMLDLGGSTIRRTSGSGSDDYVFQLWNYGAGTTNFTLTSSNGTAVLDANGYANGIFLQNVLNSKFSNIHFQHGYGGGYGNSGGIAQVRGRYNVFENITLYSYAQTLDGGGFLNSDVQYSNFTNINITGIYVTHCRYGFYFGDWDEAAGWTGSYFNRVTNLLVSIVWHDGIYLNSGATGYGVYNNTFTNCTIENNWGSGYDAIKLRPTQNNTFTQITIRNFTDAISTGTCATAFGEDALGNCSGNSITATIYGSTLTSLILTTDDNNQAVDHNFFNLTVYNGESTYFSSGTNSPIYDNILYINFTDCSSALYLDDGVITRNTFYLNFTRCGSAGHSDIWHSSSWTSITSNTFNVYATSGNPNGLYDFTNGTQSNRVYYPYS
jgi:hypothetical protein